MKILNKINEKEIFSIVKKTKGIVLVINKSNTFLYYKFESRIYKFSYDEIIRTLLLKKDINVSSFSSDSLVFKGIKIELTPKADYFVTKGILLSKKEIDMEKVLSNLLRNKEEEFIKQLREDQEKFGKLYKNKKTKKGYSFKEFNDFIAKIQSSPQKNLQNKNEILVTENKESKIVKFDTRQGFVEVVFDKNKNIVSSYAESINRDNNVSYYFNKGVVQNVFFSMREEHAERRTSKKILMLGIVGFLVFVLFTVFTFTFVFDYEVLNNAFNVLGTKWVTPWPYLFIIDYFINTFAFLIFGVLIAKAYTGKWSFNILLKIFINSNIRWLVYQITGFHEVALAVWILLMRRDLKVKTASLIGSMGSIALVRSGLQFCTAIIFIPYGAYFFSTLDWSAADNVLPGDVAAITIVTAGFIGFFFWTIGNSWLIIFVYSKKVQNIVFLCILRLTRFTKKVNYFDQVEKLDLRIKQLRVTSKKRLVDKEFLTRTITIFIFFFASEMFATTFTINMFRPTDVTNVYGLIEPVPVIWDMWNLTSGWQLIKYTNEAVWLPGGMGMIEEFSANAYSAYMGTKFEYAFESTEALHSYIALQGPSAGLIERFFNYYLPFLMKTTFLLIIFIGSAIKRTRNNRQKMIKQKNITKTKRLVPT